jgi:hypothetical protein
MASATVPPCTRKDIPLWMSLVDDAFEGGILACLAITDALDPEVCIEQHLCETVCDDLSNHDLLSRQSPVNEDEDYTDMPDDFLPLNNRHLSMIQLLGMIDISISLLLTNVHESTILMEP